MRSLVLTAVAIVVVLTIWPPTAQGKSKGVSKPKQHSSPPKEIEIDAKLMRIDELIASSKLIPQLGRDKKLRGYVLDNVVPTTAFAVLGLQNGDVITQINGVKMETPDTGMSGVKSMSETDRGEIALLRKGKAMSVRYKKK